ncbi:MAG TPA: dihydrolipoamide acetyltransferase family protein [Vicinamibacterales bacterium]
MAVSVVMPALEMAQETGKLVSWLKQEGEPVRKGEILLEVETDKAVVDVEAAGDGILAGVTARPGDVVPVGRTIAWLVQPGETPPATASPEVATRPARISPKARRLAQERGVDITQVTGSGPGGEVLADDILAAAARLPPSRAERASASLAEASGGGGKPAPTTEGSPAGRLKPAPTPESNVGAAFSRPEPLTTIGRLMAERTTHGWTTVPHFFVTRDIDAGALSAAREAMLPLADRSHGVKVTHTDLLVAIVARTLTKHPRLNASWTADGIVSHEDVNVALALAVDNAVVTAVIPRADRAPVADIAVRRRDLVERARAGKLQPADIAGATFTISNLGMFEVDAFTAIIVPPQAAILAVGAIADRVVPVDGRPGVRPMMTMTLSCDHRVVDGARAAGFMRDLGEAIRAPQL